MCILSMSHVPVVRVLLSEYCELGSMSNDLLQDRLVV